MEITEAKKTVYYLMRVHHLDDWEFKLNDNKSLCGKCLWRKKRIELSRTYIKLNDVDDVEATILHEIAHALAGEKEGHGKKWKEIAEAIGCKHLKSIAPKTIKEAKPKFKGKCPKCGHIVYGNKRSRIACSRCANKFLKDRIFIWEENK